MYYRCTDPDTSIGDWISLNFSAIPGSLLAFVVQKDEDYETVEELELGPEEDEAPECEECGWEEDDCECEDGFHAPEKVEAPAVPENHLIVPRFETHWKAAEEFPPMWGTMWEGKDAFGDSWWMCVAAGMNVYRIPQMGEFGSEVYIGVDGAGYNFYGAHWIPLRAAAAYWVCTSYDANRREHFAPEEFDADRFFRIMDVLITEGKRYGEQPWHIFRRFPHIERAYRILKPELDLKTL